MISANWSKFIIGGFFWMATKNISISFWVDLSTAVKFTLKSRVWKSKPTYKNIRSWLNIWALNTFIHSQKISSNDLNRVKRSLGLNFQQFILVFLFQTLKIGFNKQLYWIDLTNLFAGIMCHITDDK